MFPQLPYEIWKSILAHRRRDQLNQGAVKYNYLVDNFHAYQSAWLQGSTELGNSDELMEEIVQQRKVAGMAFIKLPMFGYYNRPLHFSNTVIDKLREVNIKR
jgi:hypothetical protein